MIAPRRRRIIVWTPLLLVGVGVTGALWRGPTVVTPPPADAEPGRWAHLEGAANTRDVGGYVTRDGRTVRTHMIYRSGTLARLSSSGVANFRELGIRTVIDLRNRLSPLPFFNGDVFGVYFTSSVHGCPMGFEHTERSADFYIRGVESNRDSIRQVFERLSDSTNYPLLYHCAAGTDRTGVISALLLSLLGVERDTVVRDFRLSEKVSAPGNLEAMNALLDQIDASGGIAAYLAALGVPAKQQARIRDLLLIPTGS